MLKKDKKKQSRKRRVREDEKFPTVVVSIMIILLLVLMFFCSQLGSPDSRTVSFGDSSMVPSMAPACDIKSSTIFMYPATSSDSVFNDTVYKVMYDGQYFGEFKGARNTTFINATPGAHFEYIASAKDCFTYSAHDSIQVPCQGVVYIAPELRCEREPEFSVIDMDDYKVITDGDIINARGDSVQLRWNNYYPYSDRPTYFACRYDPIAVSSIQTNFPKMPIESSDVVGEGFEVTSAREEFIFNVMIRPSSEPVKTKVTCYIIDNDFIFEDKQFKFASSTKNLEDVGMKNPSITFYIKRQ